MTAAARLISPPHTQPADRPILPADPEWDEARRAWNLTADQRPAAVWVARSIGQAQAALDYARAHGLRVAPQTTGHLGQALPALDARCCSSSRCTTAC